MKNVGYVNRSAGEIAEIYGLPGSVVLRVKVDDGGRKTFVRFEDKLGLFGIILKQLLNLDQLIEDE